jgi:hypothetical protein
VGIAYADRAVALQSAYTSGTNSEIKAKVKTAWTTFDTFMKSVKRKFSGAKTDAWSAYRASFKACKGASSSISDANNTSKEISGN